MLIKRADRVKSIGSFLIFIKNYYIIFIENIKDVITIRLWHQKLITLLPRQQLLGQHRECCALRGAGWGRKHATVDYVFTHEPERLVAYHVLIMDEMRKRGYNPDKTWYNRNWRGNTLQEQDDWCSYNECMRYWENALEGCMIYPEHNTEYLQECLDNLKGKGIDLCQVL